MHLTQLCASAHTSGLMSIPIFVGIPAGFALTSGFREAMQGCGFLDSEGLNSKVLKNDALDSEQVAPQPLVSELFLK